MEKLLELARVLDRKDKLGEFRNKFYIPPHRDGTDQHYFCGHSLGLQAKSVESVVGEDLHAWRNLGVRGHFEGALPWIDYNDRLRPLLADLTGANPPEIVAMNTLTVNLHLLMVSFFQPQGKRRKILIEKQAFPSDRYAVESQLRFHGLDPTDCLVELDQETSQQIEESTLENFLRAYGDEIALVLWPGVQYISGQAFDLERVTAAAHQAGAKVGFDLAHYIGNLPLSLHDNGCDFAAWCHYKYLNAGPGAVAGCFIHQRHHQNNDLPRFHGWWGSDRESRFRMEPDFAAATGAEAWQLSNPPILAMSPIRASLQIFLQAGMEPLREKSGALTAYLEDGIRTRLDEQIEILTPSDPARRGCQLSMRVRSGRQNGRELFRYLEERGVITDWREPDVIRVAPVPLYNRFEDCFVLLRQISAWSETTGNPAYPSAC